MLSELYQVVLVDPPWSYNDTKTGGSMKSAANQVYDVMDLEALATFPIHGLASPNSVVFMWTTNPMMREAHILLGAWGYEYKTMVTWVKTGRIGMGHWFRGNTEHCLVAKRGKVKSFKSAIRNHFEATPTGHSAKPMELYGMIDEACGHLEPKVELFSRQAFPGWHAWGNEVQSDLTLEGRQWELTNPPSSETMRAGGQTT
jgi:N6-adenosine-specific RNA methylase IME4